MVLETNKGTDDVNANSELCMSLFPPEVVPLSGSFILPGKPNVVAAGPPPTGTGTVTVTLNVCKKFKKNWNDLLAGLQRNKLEVSRTSLSLDLVSFLPSFLSVKVHPYWVSQAPRVLSYCADVLLFGPWVKYA